MGLANVTQGTTAVSNLILVTPQTNIGYQPQNGISSSIDEQLPPGFLFHYEGENTITLDSDITDHFIEDNTTIQDQIALRPVVVTVQGFIGELNDIVPKPLEPLKIISDKLTILSAYTPQLSLTALLAYNEAKFLYDNAKNIQNAFTPKWSSVNSNVRDENGILPQNQNKQQLAYLNFYSYWNKRTLFTIQTPWAILKNMAIKTLRASQDPDTRMISEFDITFKQMNFAQTVVTKLNTTTGSYGSNRGAAQSAAPATVGPNTPPEAPIPFDQLTAP